MDRVSNVRRRGAAWLIAPAMTALITLAGSLAIPHARLAVARGERDAAMARSDERARLLADLTAFQGQGGVEALERSLRAARARIPEHCTSLFAQAALEESLAQFAISVDRAEVLGTLDVGGSEADALLRARPLDVRGRARVAELRRWLLELDSLAGPLALRELTVARPSESDDPLLQEFRLVAWLLHRPQD